MSVSHEGQEDNIEGQPLTQNGEDEDTDDHGTISLEARPSNSEIFRFMVLGSKDSLMNQACGIILQLTQKEDVRNIGTCIVRESQISGQEVSVLKTPSYWLEHLKSHLFFSNGVKSIRNEMEFCESLLFPGPHVFLLVLGDPHNSGKEDLLLQAVSNVYGRDALDYSMVVFMADIGNIDIVQNYCVKKCKNRYHILENTENSVVKLLDTIKRMHRNKKHYFTKHAELLEKAYKYFQTEFEKECKKGQHILKTELVRMKKTVKDQRNEITELKRQVELKEDLRKELDDSRVRENRLRKYLDYSKEGENQLGKDLDDSKVREDRLRKYLDDSKERENQLGKYLDDSKVREDQLKVDIIKLQMEIEHLKDILKNKTQRDLDKRVTELETRERDVSQSIGTTAHPPADTFRCLHKGDGAESSDEASQATQSDLTEGFKPVRRNSFQHEPPYISK